MNVRHEQPTSTQSRRTTDSAPAPADGRGRAWIAGAACAASAMFLVGTLTAVSALIADYPVYGGQAVRYAAAAAILLAVARLRGPATERLTRRDVALLVALAMTGLVIFNVAVIESANASGPTLAGTVLGTVPLVLALVGGRPSPRVVAAAAVVVAGATLATGLGSGTPAGLAWSLVALGCEVCFSLLALPLLPRLGAVRVSAYACALAVPLLVAIGLALDGGGILRPPTAAEALGLGYLAVVITVIAFLLWYTGLPRLGPQRAGLLAGLIPVGSLVTTVVLGLGTPTTADLAGAGLVIAGIVLGLRGGVVISRKT
ncbi:DMT family transporter [Thermopolyspora flexuosa]|nr:DMT family transporter [Thermopolyspora flexuosa]